MKEEWRVEHDLTPFNTLGLPCLAERFAEPVTVVALRRLLRLAAERNWPVTLLGGGSNLILPERLAGLVIRPSLKHWWLERQSSSVRVHVGAGVEWHPLVMALAARGLWGTENLALIPGHCGAAPIQNIGAYGVELCEVVEAVEVLFLESGHSAVLTPEECGFGYRDSIFKGELAGRVAITGLTLRLSRTPLPRVAYGDLAQRVGPLPTPLEVAEAVCAIRREKLPDPAELGNAGSFFKNPIVERGMAELLVAEWPDMPRFELACGGVKLAAGWLIDRCGLKGYRLGHFGVAPPQARVLGDLGCGYAGKQHALAARLAA
ncbi:MAG: UDP-N-acetylmuramate dehydrogenase, partial [Halomonas sp.]